MHAILHIGHKKPAHAPCEQFWHGTGADAPLTTARNRFVEAIVRGKGIDTADVTSDAVSQAVVAARRAMAPGGVPLRPELLAAFAAGGDHLAVALSQITEATRMRSGMQFLDFALAALGAAGINHLFIFVDQLEDLATNLGITSAKRSKEIGRIRDLLEEQPYAGRLHQILTFHTEAAIKLARYWEPQRLPRFDIAADNLSVIVEPRGMTTNDQAIDVIKAYLEVKRVGSPSDELSPFEPAAVSVLRTVSQGRVGILLTKAHGLFHAAAEAGVETIDADFATKFFSGALTSNAVYGHNESVTVATGIDDLLLGE
jgi:hypothetical protein